MAPRGKAASRKSTAITLIVILVLVAGAFGYGYYWFNQPSATYNPQQALAACNAAKNIGCQDSLDAGALCQNGSLLTSADALNDDQLLACGSRNAMRAKRTRAF